MGVRAVRLLMGCIALFGLPAAACAANTGHSTYLGQQSREIKALSDEDISALRNGDGMGFAKAADLNHYPGPRHVLALARELKLTENQIAQVTVIRDRMSAAARPLGNELIDRERGLDQLFSYTNITPERLLTETAAIGDIQGRLRAVHLAAHLETRAILNAEQIAEYDKWRGYADTGRASAAGRDIAGHHH
jgi:LTXXQ motif family protein